MEERIQRVVKKNKSLFTDHMKKFITTALVVVSLHCTGQSPFYRDKGVGGDSFSDVRECVLIAFRAQIGMIEALNYYEL